jgi:hypothetical protein
MAIGAAPRRCATQGQLPILDESEYGIEGVNIGVSVSIFPPDREEGAKKSNIFLRGDDQVFSSIVIKKNGMHAKGAI